MTEQQIAFQLLRSALEDSTPDLGSTTMDTARWWSLFRLLQRNHVATLCYGPAAAAGASREVLMPWLAEHEKAIGWHRYQRQVLRDVVDTMGRHGIQTLVLKGSHTARYYPNPELREYGDLDLYFYDQHDEADEIARRELGVDISNDAHHHSKYNYRGVTVESHYDFVNTHYPPSNSHYEVLLKELAPSPTFEVLFLLRHMACHFASSRITMRDLADWALTCRALQDKADWQMVGKVIVEYGMTVFAAFLNDISEKRLGMAIPTTSATHTPLPTTLYPLIEHDIVYGSPKSDDKNTDGLARLGWKLRRWRTLGWKRRMVYNDPPARLLLATLTSHATKPRSILHKQ